MPDTRPTAATLTALICLSSPTAAPAMDGVYKLTSDALCTAEGGEGLLKIEDGILYGASSRCRMTNPLDVNDMDATLYDMVCIGEGAGWQERAMMMRAASGGLILVWDGYAFEYEACPTPTVRPQPRPAETAPSLADAAPETRPVGPPPQRPEALVD